jgi:hypothetical protein
MRGKKRKVVKGPIAKELYILWQTHMRCLKKIMPAADQATLPLKRQ